MALKRQTGNKLRVPDDIAHLIHGAHPQLKRKIKAASRVILNNPDIGKSLRNDLKSLKSFRISRFRMIYRISSDNHIEIVAIGPRKTIYKETFRLIAKETQRVAPGFPRFL